jgi:hypothetical protein
MPAGVLTRGDADLIAVALLLIFAALLAILTLRARRGPWFAMRPIRAYERLRRLASRAAESGQPIHVALGSGQLGSPSTPEALMGLAVYDYLARRAAPYGQAAPASTGSPTILAAAQGVLLDARQNMSADGYTAREVVFAGPDAMAYAAGTAEELRQREYTASVMLGQFGSEGLWIAEAAARRGLPRLGGTSEPAAMALLAVAVDEPVIGEEIYAAGAYLERPSHLGSLAAQDAMRALLLLAMIAGVAAVSLGYLQ